jgi:N-acetylmuramoyl-L-alanine amidase
VPDSTPRPRSRTKRERPGFSVKPSWIAIAAAIAVVVVVAIVLVVRSTGPKGPIIVVDAGHGGTYSNTGIGGIKENDLNLAIAKRLAKKLRSRGYRVVMTRTSKKKVAEEIIANWRYAGEPGRTWAYGAEKTPNEQAAAARSDLQARVDIANEAGADAFVSIHNNASKDVTARGTETFAYRGDAPGKALAASVLDAVGARTGGPTRGSFGSGLYVCRWTNMPAVLVEGAYFTNEEDAKALKSGRFQDKLAEGIADGIDRWFVTYPLREREPQLAAADAASLATTTSAAAYPKGSPVAVLLPESATALGPSASTLAAKLGAPLLLTSDKDLSPGLIAELQRLKPDRIVILGISNDQDLEAISAAVTQATGSRASIETVAENSAPAAAALAAGYITIPSSGEVVIADVADPDALTALAPYVARKLVPVLLSKDGKLGDEGLVYLSANSGRIKRVLSIGCAKPAAEPEGWPVTAVNNSDPDALAANLLANTDPAKSKRKLKPVAVDPRSAPSVYTAATEAARRKQPLVQVREGILGPYAREFLVNRTAVVNRFLLMRSEGSLPPVAGNSLYKSVGR